jgi:hypothetical protein
MKYFAAFALAAWAGIVVAAAISIFQLGFYERIYGPSTTFVMVLWYAAFPSLLAGASAWSGTLGRKRRAMTLPAVLAPFAIARFALSRYGILPPVPITGERDAALDVPGLGADDHARPQ